MNEVNTAINLKPFRRNLFVLYKDNLKHSDTKIERCFSSIVESLAQNQNEVIKLCNYLIKNESQSPMGWHGLGLHLLFLAKRKEELMFRNVSYKQAIDCLMKAFIIKPPNKILLLDIALFHALTWDYEQSMYILRGLYPYCEKDPILKEQLVLVGGLSLVNKYKKEAISAYIKKDYLKMIDKFKKILFDIGVGDPIAYNWLIKMSDPKSISIHEKIKLAVKWQQTDSTNPWPYYYLGEFSVLENDPVNASKFFEKSLILFNEVHHDLIFIKAAKINTYYTKSIVQWLNLQLDEAKKSIDITLRQAKGFMSKESITNYENVKFGIGIASKILDLSKAGNFLDLYNKVSLINKLFSNLLNNEKNISKSAWLQLNFTTTLQSILQPLLIRRYRLKRILPTVYQFKVKGKIYKQWMSFCPNDTKIDAPLYTLNSIRKEYIGIGDEKGIMWVNALEKFIMAAHKHKSIEEITEEVQKKLIECLTPSFELISKEALILEKMEYMNDKDGIIDVLKKEMEKLPERIATKVNANAGEILKARSDDLQHEIQKIPEVINAGMEEWKKIQKVDRETETLSVITEKRINILTNVDAVGKPYKGTPEPKEVSLTQLKELLVKTTHDRNSYLLWVVDEAIEGIDEKIKGIFIRGEKVLLSAIPQIFLLIHIAFPNTCISYANLWTAVGPTEKGRNLIFSKDTNDRIRIYRWFQRLKKETKAIKKLNWSNFIINKKKRRLEYGKNSGLFFSGYTFIPGDEKFFYVYPSDKYRLK